MKSSRSINDPFGDPRLSKILWTVVEVVLLSLSFSLWTFVIVVANTLTYTNLCLMHVRCGRETSLPRILKGDERVASDSDKHCGSIVVYACVYVCVCIYCWWCMHQCGPMHQGRHLPASSVIMQMLVSRFKIGHTLTRWLFQRLRSITNSNQQPGPMDGIIEPIEPTTHRTNQPSHQKKKHLFS